MSDFITLLEFEFILNSNPKIASGQKAYMKNKFDFLGLSSPIRREIQKPFLLKIFLPPKNELENSVRTLWLEPYREYQYFAQELAFMYNKQIQKNDIELFEFMVLHKSWWDTVDFIAVKLMGDYFKQFPNQRDVRIENWLQSGNIWLQRSALLYQLKYKKELDNDFLSYIINHLLGSKEFFINKAIGWVLREYSRVNPDWVLQFCEKTTMSNLSRKEALRLIL